MDPERGILLGTTSLASRLQASIHPYASLESDCAFSFRVSNAAPKGQFRPSGEPRNREELYHRWRSKQDVVLRRQHRAGEEVLVDWAGDSVPVYERRT